MAFEAKSYFQLQILFAIPVQHSRLFQHYGYSIILTASPEPQPPTNFNDKTQPQKLNRLTAITRGAAAGKGGAR